MENPLRKKCPKCSKAIDRGTEFCNIHGGRIPQVAVKEQPNAPLHVNSAT